MAITINGNGSITGLSAGGLPDGSVTTDDLASSVQTQLCKAWVNFNGTGTVAIRANYNVSSITDNGTGNYTVNFSNALADANYSAVCGYKPSSSSTYVANISSQSSSTLTCYFLNYANGLSLDQTIVNIAVFR